MSDKKLTLKELEAIELKFEGFGDYGLHDGFFNAIAVIDGTEYDFQCCSNEDETGVNFDDCGYDDGLCGDANEKLANVIGWENLYELLKIAVEHNKGFTYGDE